VVVTAGAALADEVGFANLTMDLLAKRFGVRTPSLYKHIPSLYALKRGIAIEAKQEFGAALARAAAGRSGPDAVHAFAGTYRRWVLDHPGRYAATVRAPSPDEGLQILLDIVTGLVPPTVSAIDVARALRSALHGFATLESAGGFGLADDLDRSYHQLVEAVTAVIVPP
jgi:AcrR family transcriptional regulator